MQLISLFSGIGGFELASEWAVWDNVVSCEINDFGHKVLSYYWPDAYHHRDIKDLNRETIEKNSRWDAGKPTIVVGGFPCQPFSMAGKRKGTEDDRHLWPEMLRIIREIKPDWVVGENVFGLINWDGGVVFEQVQADLEAQGYEVQPYVLPAVSVNAPHRRDRVWFVAHRSAGIKGTSFRGRNVETSQHGDSRHGGEGSPPHTTGNAVTGQDGEGNSVEGTRVATNDESGGGQFTPVQSKGLDDLQRDATDTDSKRHEEQFPSAKPGEPCGFDCQEDTEQRHGFIANTEPTRRERGNRLQASERLKHGAWDNWPTVEPTICREHDGIPSRLAGITVSKHRNESIKAYGNAVVPQVVYQIFKAINQYESYQSGRKKISPSQQSKSTE